VSDRESAALGRREIGGPSAFGGDRRRFFELLWLSSVAEFKLRYVGSVMGYAWTLVRPLLLFGVLYVVFTQVLRFGDEVPHYASMLILNIMLYQFFADATTAAVKSVVGSENVVRKMQFPRIVTPFSVVLTAAFTLGTNLLAVFVFILISGVSPTWTWLLLPVLILALIALTTGIVLILATLYVWFRDVDHIWSVFARALFYASPILYPITFVPEGTLRTIAFANPLTPLFTLARSWVIDPTAPSLGEVAGADWVLAMPLVIAVGLVVVGLWYFNRAAPRVAEAL
jgi:ABC-2 type transport system permease protein